MEQCRAARHCWGLGNMLEAMNTGRTVKLLCKPVVAFGHQAAWWLGVHWWLGLCLGFGLHLRPRGVMLIGAAAAWREVLYFLDLFKCAATAAYCIMWSASLLLRISEA